MARLAWKPKDTSARQRELRARIDHCEQHKRTIEDRVSKIRALGERNGLSPSQVAANLQAYLGEKSYEEWLMLYDALIKEAQEELDAVSRVSSPVEEAETRKDILIASGITAAFILLLLVFFLPQPISVLTGNVVGAPAGEPVQGGVDGGLVGATILLIIFLGVVILGVVKHNHRIAE